MSIDLSKIGALLKDKREEEGLNVFQVSEALFLRRSVIEALEAGDWNSLPHQVYVKGYVKEYAVFLKIHDIITPELLETVEKSERPLSEIIPEQMKSAKYGRARISRRIFSVSIAFVLAGTLFVIGTSQKKPDNTSGIENTTQTSATSYVNQGDSSSGAEMQESKRLMITCHERTWISIIIDGAEKKEFMLSPQEVIVLNAKGNFDLLVGNAGGVKLILDGKNIDFTGRSGEVKRIKLS
jgi:cytoskeletal protein RodZ